MHNKNLWSPWRYEYLKNLDTQAKQFEEEVCNKPNFISTYFNNPREDEKQLVIYRSQDGIIFLNRYPYSNGHLLVALGKPQSALLNYSRAERNALWALVEKGVSLMQEKLSPQGLNIGINEGQASGAGIPQHLHVHIVPRWHGDTNFMSTISEVRVIPSSLEEMWKTYKSKKPFEGKS